MVLEAQLADAAVLKKIVDAMKDLVTDANLECSEEGIHMQAMDSSHVSLVALKMKADGWKSFRCDRPASLGLSLANLAKVLKCAQSDDVLTVTAGDDADVCTLTFQNTEGDDADRVSTFEIKLMDIDTEHLGIPDTEYKCVVRMPAGDFQRIVRDMSVLGDTCVLGVSKEGVSFAVKGDLGTGRMLRKQNKTGDKEEEHVTIEMEEAVELTFALRYLNFFTKATPLASRVSLHLSRDVPLMVEYKIEGLGYMRFYLAPKIDEEAAA